MTCGIYKITNRRTGEVYVGQSTNIEKRIETHFKELENYSHRNKGMQDDFNRGDEFSWEILETTDCNRKELHEKEVVWIMRENSFDRGYNQTPGGTYDKHKGEIGFGGGRLEEKYENNYDPFELFKFNRDLKKYNCIIEFNEGFYNLHKIEEDKAAITVGVFKGFTKNHNPIIKIGPYIIYNIKSIINLTKDHRNKSFLISAPNNSIYFNIIKQYITKKEELTNYLNQKTTINTIKRKIQKQIQNNTITTTTQINNTIKQEEQKIKQEQKKQELNDYLNQKITSKAIKEKIKKQIQNNTITTTTQINNTIKQEQKKQKELNNYLKTQTNNKNIIQKIQKQIQNNTITTTTQINNYLNQIIKQEELNNYLNQKITSKAIKEKIKQEIQNNTITTTTQINNTIKQKEQKIKRELNNYLKTQTNNINLIQKIKQEIQNNTITTTTQINNTIKQEEIEELKKIVNLKSYLKTRTKKLGIINDLTIEIENGTLKTKKDVDKKIMKKESIFGLIKSIFK